jgi:hypothetical protein
MNKLAVRAKTSVAGFYPADLQGMTAERTVLVFTHNGSNLPDTAIDDSCGADVRIIYPLIAKFNTRNHP